jgi:hypothetical protein
MLEMKTVLFIMTALSLAGCSSSDKPTSPPAQAEKITAEYFPMADGDAWYYSSSTEPLMIWSVSGDTLINGVACKKIMQDLNHYYMACRIDNEGYKIYFREGLSVDPPFVIDFNWKKDEINYINIGGIGIIPIRFIGYCSKEVTAGQFDSVLKICYFPGDDEFGYYEYYAKGVGLLDDENYSLDSAFIGGIWYK